MDTQQNQPQPVKSTNPAMWIVIAVVILISIMATGLVGVNWYYKEKKEATKITETINRLANTNSQKVCNFQEVWCETKQKCLVVGQEPCSNINLEDYLSKANIENFGPDEILYISDGDVWKTTGSINNKLKLIDNDNIIEAEYSQDKQYLAYSAIIPITEIVTNSDGTTEILEMIDEYDAPRTLYIANNFGADSIVVKENIRRWGWISNTNLIWYETSSLQQIFSWGYHGDNNIWIFDTSTRKSEELIPTDINKWGISNYNLGFQWSPDGRKLVFIGNLLDSEGNHKTRAIMVKDRITKKTQTLLWLPWIGGDRGGPAPIPDIFWDNSSDYIYTGFTPVIEVSGDFDIEYHNSLKSGYISILKIPVDGSNLKELTDPTPSYMMTEEQAIRLNFSDDFSKVLYYIAELDDDTDIESSYDWIWGITDGNNSQITKITDLKSNESWVVDVGCEECNICVRSYDKSYPSYISDDFAYFLYNSVVENDVWFVIDKFNFNENKQEELIRVPSFGGENQFYDISYYPESDIILFRVNNTLYQLHNGGLSILLENVLDINYYSN